MFKWSLCNWVNLYYISRKNIYKNKICMLVIDLTHLLWHKNDLYLPKTWKPNLCLHVAPDSYNYFCLWILFTIYKNIWTMLTIYSWFFFTCVNVKALVLNKGQACLVMYYRIIACLFVSLRSTLHPVVFITTVYLLS